MWEMKVKRSAAQRRCFWSTAQHSTAWDSIGWWGVTIDTGIRRLFILSVKLGTGTGCFIKLLNGSQAGMGMGMGILDTAPSRVVTIRMGITGRSGPPGS